MGVPSLLDSVMFCHMCNSAYVLCVCVYVCMCECKCCVQNDKGSFLHTIYTDTLA